MPPNMEPLLPTKCEYCGADRIPKSYWEPLSGEWWYYDHNAWPDCIKYLRSLIDDIGSRRIV